MSEKPRTVRLRSGIETVNGITGETRPVYSEYVLLEDYQELQTALTAALARADAAEHFQYEGSTLQRLDKLVHELTGDEGEDDSFTVLRRKWRALKAEGKQLEKERDEARKDAERYQKVTTMGIPCQDEKGFYVIRVGQAVDSLVDKFQHPFSAIERGR